jgi:hypothetical protein
MEHIERESMEFDVVIVGAGPAGLSAAIKIRQLAIENNLNDLSVCVVEKGSEVGAHILSGAVLEPRAINELFPNWKEEDKFYLKTPVEQIEIEVEDEPLFVNQVDQVEIAGKIYLQLTTTTHDVVIVDEDHPIFMRAFQGELRPYVHVRFGINALIQRAAFFHLVEMGELSDDAEGQAKLSLQSGDLLLQLGT